MEAGKWSHLLNCSAGQWTKSVEFQSPFDTTFMLLCAYFLELSQNLTCLAKESEQSEAPFPATTADLHRQSPALTCLHLCSLSRAVAWTVCVQKLLMGRTWCSGVCPEAQILLDVQLVAAYSLYEHGGFDPRVLKSVETLLWNKVWVLESDRDVSGIKNSLIGAKDVVSGLNMRCDSFLRKTVFENISLCHQLTIMMKKEVKRGAQFLLGGKTQKCEWLSFVWGSIINH